MKEYFKTFWNNLKEIFVDFVSRAKEKGHLITSQRQAIITLIERAIEVNGSYKPIDQFSLLNVELNSSKSSFKETANCSTRFEFFTTNSVCREPRYR